MSSIAAETTILLSWDRIFVPRGTRSPFYWEAWFVITLNTLFYFVATFLFIFAKSLVAKSWNIFFSGSSLVGRKTLGLVAAGINLFIDVSTFVVPQLVI